MVCGAGPDPFGAVKRQRGAGRHTLLADPTRSLPPCSLCSRALDLGLTSSSFQMATSLCPVFSKGTFASSCVPRGSRSDQQALGVEPLPGAPRAPGGSVSAPPVTGAPRVCEPRRTGSARRGAFCGCSGRGRGQRCGQLPRRCVLRDPPSPRPDAPAEAARVRPVSGAGTGPVCRGCPFPFAQTKILASVSETQGAREIRALSK